MPLMQGTLSFPSIQLLSSYWTCQQNQNQNHKETFAYHKLFKFDLKGQTWTCHFNWVYKSNFNRWLGISHRGSLDIGCCWYSLCSVLTLRLLVLRTWNIWFTPEACFFLTSKNATLVLFEPEWMNVFLWLLLAGFWHVSEWQHLHFSLSVE